MHGLTKKIIITTLSLILISFSSNGAKAYDDKITHPNITDKAVKISVLKNYLSQNIGIEFSKDFESEINGKKVIEWIMDGSTDEDTPACRASNHFHDPLKPWNESYMSDEPLWLDIKCFSWAPWYSNITWATGYLSLSPGGQKQTFSSNPDYAPVNWDKARDSYYKALTATAKEDREANFASTFKTVGHVLHLLEDMAVPAHVRNDFTSHVAFNKMTSDNFVKWFGNHYEYYVQTHGNTVTGFDASAIQYPSFTNTRLTDFWDTDQYTGDNPSSGLSIGLAEFTNANYLSDSTIPYTLRMPYHMYTYPKIDDPNKLQICSDYEPGSLDKRPYLSRIDRGPCPLITEARTVDHFAALGFWNDFSVNTIIDSFLNLDPTMLATPISLDDNVQKTYAQDLIPRAVGYSAGLLDYFFRGDINLVIDGSRYKIANLSNENIEGKLNSFKLYYDDANDNRNEIQLSFYDEFGAQYTNPDTMLTIPANTNSSFTIGYQSIPATSKNLILVFKGKLGNEDNAVVVRVTPLDLARMHFIVFRDGDNQLITNPDDFGGTYNTYGVYRVIPVIDKTVATSPPYITGWRLESVDGTAKLVQEGTVPGNRRLYHRLDVTVNGQPITAFRMEHSTGSFDGAYYVHGHSGEDTWSGNAFHLNVSAECDSYDMYFLPFKSSELIRVSDSRNFYNSQIGVRTDFNVSNFSTVDKWEIYSYHERYWAPSPF